ncbi:MULTISPECIES: hypothetical protein [Candidatus Nitrosocaldus]|jgi:predicted nucleic acid-binding Zn finger protein|uniref:SWIM-type domain-containing protein n=1 Tax=Candidatus Nitrosocaldus cavascurensis TaxID=2058097 RepID=A0A2K5ASQ5_9ARCH|nr:MULTISPECIES: hypothetical protein [Candidatus Nitrosocaldus]SPC34644.1 conserved protein of unknown function [Candidatus Nitrosocaldus cavascurensis]
MERAERIACRKAVKLHVFMPSNRRIWTVVGNRHEYWIRPPDYCTCKDYYFRARAVAIEERGEGKASCYHLKAVEIAEVREMVDEVHFNDDEYDGFIRALIDMMYKQVTKDNDC